MEDKLTFQISGPPTEYVPASPQGVLESQLLEELGFCGCGMPEEALRYVYDSLLIVKEWIEGERDDTWDDFYKRQSEKERAHFGSHGATYFMWYFLDEKGYTEHGGSVPGWLTPEGEALLAKLKTYLEGLGAEASSQGVTLATKDR